MTDDSARKRKRHSDLTDLMADPVQKSNKSSKSYTTAQKNAINQYTSLTQSDKTSAAKVLRQHNWNVEAAANAFYAGNTNNAPNPHKNALNKLFDKYRDDPANEPDEVGMQGMMSMLGDMGVDLESVDLLIFSELVQSPTLGTLTRENFVTGLSSQSVSDGSKISNLVHQRQAQLSNPNSKPTFRSIYKHTFVIARAQGQKSVALDSAIEYWRLLFSEPSMVWSTTSTPWLDWWIEFLQERWKKSVNKDMWDQTLNFAYKTLEDESLKWWSEDSAWPGVIDEFVEYVQKDKRGGGEEAMDVS